jgi:hypothetical protein
LEDAAMFRFLLCSIVLVLTASVMAGTDKTTKATIQSLKAEIKLLKARQKADVKALEDRYKALIAQLDNADLKLEALRAELRKEEKLLLAEVKDKTEKQRIRTQFEGWIKADTLDIKTRKKIIKELRAEKTAQVKRLKAEYTAKIDPLEVQVKALEASSTAKSKK